MQKQKLTLHKLAPILEGWSLASAGRTWQTIPVSAQALLILAARDLLKRPVLWIGHGVHALEEFHRDLVTLAPLGQNPSTPPLFFPAMESFSGRARETDPEIEGIRIRTLLELANPPQPGSAAPLPPVLATCIQAMQVQTFCPEEILSQTFVLQTGSELERELLTQHLERTGYEFVPEVETRGQATVKGGIVDVWSPDQSWPVRIELFGSTLDSLREFDPLEQKSVRKRDQFTLAPAHEPLARAPDSHPTGSLADFLPGNCIVWWSDLEQIREHAELYHHLATESGLTRGVSDFDTVLARVHALPGCVCISTSDLPETIPGNDPEALPDFAQLPHIHAGTPTFAEPDAAENARRALIADLIRRSRSGFEVHLFLDTQGSREHFLELWPVNHGDAVQIHTGVLSEGFVSEKAGIVLVAESDFYGRRKTLTERYTPQKGGARPVAGMRVAELTDMEPGDLVVHVDHGIGRYLGLFEIQVNGQLQEVLTIEYAENARLHVPTAQAHLLSRYVGLTRHLPRLHKLGGRSWGRERESAEKAIRDLAASLLETQAARDLLSGFAFPADNTWQREFEAAFPYRETADQTRAIDDVKRDMQSTRPMDRLICGDAGYGKTEVAMRAAFKAVMAQKQVAMLVPTTLLAQQHQQTFSERMAAFPVRIEMLSRFCSRGRQKEIIRGLAEGTVDIVIGTHALLQEGLAFRDLGIVIIDEEQRFGVSHKEHLKQMRNLVDVLTLSATPIPRTLYMSMTGARDMSLMQTPPRERLAVETIVSRNTDTVIRDAILRERNRDGQVFYLHNRVQTIETVRQRLLRILPDLRVAVAHGQMSSGALAPIIRRFVAGEYDLLLCTTIIESGTDIPRVNTILIDRADRFGMADLYQLRGRVGRSHHKGYAYLLLPSHGQIDAIARKRITAVKKYSSLSAGFNIALRDLEIRGAGNILGAAQSGHITAIGFGLYCQLLKRTVARLKGTAPPPVIDVDLRLDFIRYSPSQAASEGTAMIPYAYIEDERLRIRTYRKLAEAVSLEDVEALGAELTDRYGPTPPAVQRLLTVAQLRMVAQNLGIREVEARNGKIIVRLANSPDPVMPGCRFPRLTTATPDDQLRELLRMLPNLVRSVRPAE